MKFLRDGFARTGVIERLEMLHVLHLAGKLFLEGSLHVVCRDRVLGNDRIVASANECRPDFRRERLVGSQASRLGEGAQRFLRIFTELAVYFPWREFRPVEQYLSLYVRRFYSVLRRR